MIFVVMTRSLRNIDQDDPISSLVLYNRVHHIRSLQKGLTRQKTELSPRMSHA